MGVPEKWVALPTMVICSGLLSLRGLPIPKAVPWVPATCFSVGGLLRYSRGLGCPMTSWPALSQRLGMSISLPFSAQTGMKLGVPSGTRLDR